MRFLFLLGLLITLAVAPAEAQDSTSAPDAVLTNDQEAALFGLPVLATVGATALLVRADVPAVALGLPLVPVAAVCATGSGTGIDGDCLHAVRTTMLWSLPGYALVGIGSGADIYDDVRLSFVLLGGFYLLVVPPFAAIESYRLSAERSALSVAPAVVSDPASHRLVPGMQLRLGL